MFPSPDSGNTDTPTERNFFAWADKVTDGENPGVPTGDQPRWTVNLTGLPVCLNADGQVVGWVATNVMGVYAEEVRDVFVRAVRDAAQVPALQATAQRWEQAQKLAGWLKGGLPAPGSTRWRRSYDALLDLLTEAPDGET